MIEQAGRQGPPAIFKRETLFEIMNDRQLRLFDHPAIHRLAMHLFQSGDQSPALHAQLVRGLEQLSWIGTIEAHPFRENMPPLFEPIDIDHWWGRLPDARAYGVPEVAYCKNVGLVGIPGAGKTSMLALICSQLARTSRVVVFEIKPELRKLIGLPRLGEFWTTLSFARCLIALLKAPPGVTPREWDPTFVECMANSYSLHASRRALLDLLGRTRSRVGVYARLTDLEETIANWTVGRGYREQGYKEALIWTVRSLRETAPNLDVADSNALELIFAPEPGGIILETCLPVEHYCFVVSWLLLWVFSWRRKSGVRHPQLVLVLDDATGALDIQRDRDAPGGISPLAQVMLLGRALGVGVIWTTHLLKEVSTKVRAATESYVVLGPSGDDLPAIKRLLGTTPEQTDCIRSLAQDEAVIYAPSTHSRAQLCTFPYVDAPVDESLIESRQAEFLSKIKILRRKCAAAPRATSQDLLTNEQLRLLTEPGFHPDEMVTVHYERVELDRELGRRALETLQRLGLVNVHRVSSGGRGGRLSLLEVTVAGKQELTRRGFTPIELPTKGGFLHKVGAFRQARIDRAKGARVAFEQVVLGVRADMLSEYPDGRLIAYQFGMSDTDYEAKNLPVLIRAGGIDRVVFVGKDRAFVQAVERKLLEKLTAEERSKLEMVCLGDVLQTEVRGKDK